MSTPPMRKISTFTKLLILIVVVAYGIGAFGLAKGVHHHNDAIRALEDGLAKAPATAADGSPGIAEQGLLGGEAARALSTRFGLGLERDGTLDARKGIRSLRHEMERWRLILAAVHLLGLAWILRAFVWPVVKPLLQAEIKRLESNMAEAEEAHGKAQAEHDAFQKVLERFDADVKAMREDERNRGKREAEEIILSADRAVKVIEAGCQDCIHTALEEARNAVKARFAQTVHDRVEKAMIDRLDDAGRSAFIDLGLKQLEEVTWTRS